MALPVSPPPKSRDVAVLGWAGITVRVAWTLLQLGIKVRADVLRDARTHAILSIEPTTALPHAEDLAAQATRHFVARARGQRPDDAWPLDARMPLSGRWIRALDRSLDANARLLFRKHYGDARTLPHLEQTLGVERVHLEAVIGGLREAIRKIGLRDGLPLEDWSDERLDQLLVRLAAYAPGPCPPVIDVVEGAHREHVRGCARCDRMLRLVRNGILAVDDLLPPTLGARPSGRVEVLVVQFHPDRRTTRAPFAREVETRCYPLGDDLLLFDAAARGPVDELLRIACEVGEPAAQDLRGVVLGGVGAWSPHGLLGPLCDQVERAVHGQGWGTVDGIEVLPQVLPPAPSSRWAWAGVGVLAAASLMLMRMAWVAHMAPTELSELAVVGAVGHDGTWVTFDAPDEDPVGVVVEDLTGLTVVAAGTAASDKAPLAVGDGSYRVHGQRRVLVVRHDEPLALEALVASTGSAEDPLMALASALQQTHPTADVEVSP